MTERESLIARIRQIRQGVEAGGQPADPGATTPEQDQIRALDSRLTHLEHLVQGLQDSVHREARRQQERIAGLETRTEPGETSRTQSENARHHGR